MTQYSSDHFWMTIMQNVCQTVFLYQTKLIPAFERTSWSVFFYCVYVGGGEWLKNLALFAPCRH